MYGRLCLKVITERVESDIQRPDVHITVSQIPEKHMPPNSIPIPVQHERYISMSSNDQEEDTVIRAASEQEFSPPPPPPADAMPWPKVENTQKPNFTRAPSIPRRQSSLSNAGISHPPPPPIPNISFSDSIHVVRS